MRATGGGRHLNKKKNQNTTKKAQSKKRRGVFGDKPLSKNKKTQKNRGKKFTNTTHGLRQEKIKIVKKRGNKNERKGRKRG